MRGLLQMLMGNIERRHDGDSFVADDLAGVSNFTHFLVQIIHHEIATAHQGQKDHAWMPKFQSPW